MIFTGHVTCGFQKTLVVGGSRQLLMKRWPGLPFQKHMSGIILSSGDGVFFLVFCIGVAMKATKTTQVSHPSKAES